MLAIRMQRTGRKGHAMFRVVVQDSRVTPTSGRVVALIGSYDPHAKTTIIAKDKAVYYLEHGAQPSARVVSLFVKEGMKMPKWVVAPDAKKRAIRNPDKLRKNRAPEPVAVDTPTEPATPASESKEQSEAPVAAAEQAAASTDKSAAG